MSKLNIGMAQFGLDYGTFNKTERASSINFKNILTLAKKPYKYIGYCFKLWIEWTGFRKNWHKRFLSYYRLNHPKQITSDKHYDEVFSKDKK